MGVVVTMLAHYSLCVRAFAFNDEEGIVHSWRNLWNRDDLAS